MKHLYTTTTLIAASMFVGSTDATTVYMDFGTFTTTGNASGVQYNDIGISSFVASGLAPLELNGAPGTTSPIALLDTTNTNSGWSLQIDVTNAGGGVFGNQNNITNAGPFPTSLSGIESSALGSFMYANRFETMDWTFSGLDDSKLYDIVIYGNGRDFDNPVDAVMTFTPSIGGGADFTEKQLDADFSDSVNDDVLTWTGVTSVNGDIEFALESGFEGWINFVSITEVPEPGSLALLGLGGLAMLRRRRD